MKVTILKMPWKTKHFNRGQKVFVLIMSGNMACQVRGKFRSKGRRISVWIKWNEPHIMKFKEIEISDSDYTNIINN